MRAIHNIQITPIAQSSQSRCWLQAISRLCWCTLSQKSSLKHKDNTNKSTKKLNVFNKFYCFVFSKSIFFCLPISVFVFLCSFSSLLFQFIWLDGLIFFLSFFFFTCIHCYKKVSHSVVPDSATPWTVAHQAPLVHGVLQARILEWVAILFSRGSSQSRDRTWVSSIAGRFNSLPSEPPGKSHCYIFTYLLTFFGCAGSSLLPAGFL